MKISGQPKKRVALLASSVLICLANISQAQLSQISIMPGHPSSPTIFQATGTMNVNFPGGLSFERSSGGTIVKQVIIPFSSNPDNSPTSSTSRITSLDGGVTWGSVSTPPAPLNDAGMTFRDLNNGLITFPYAYTNPFYNTISTDNGANWSQSAAQSSNASLHFHRSVLEEPNGDMYAVGYTGEQIRLMKRVAGTNAWTLLAIPMKGGADGDGGQYSEPTIERCADGSWLVVCRHASPTTEMRWSRSTDKGVTWSAHQALTGIPIGSGYSIDVDPHLKLMPNGVLVITYGSRKTDNTYCDDKMAFSYNNGTTWNNGQIVFSGTNSLGPPGTMTSGYTAAVPVSAHRLMYVGDTGTSWTYSAGVHPSPNPYSIWGKYVDLVLPQQNRIDLKGKLAAGSLTIMPGTTLNFADPNFPETQPAGAFDGSTDYWSSAIGTTSGVLQLDLQKSYRITNIGLAMLFGKQQSALVEYSVDGSTWLPAGVSYNNVTHYALNYTDVTDFDARYIRVTASGTGQIGISELELYEASSTFENNAVSVTTQPHGVIPPGWTSDGTSSTQYGVSVQEGYGYQSSRALKLYDGSSNWRAGIKKIVSGSNTKTLEFKCRIASLPTGTSFSVPIIGTVSGAENKVFWLAAFASTATTAVVKVNVNNGGWVQIGTATLPISGTVWKRIKIVTNVSANTATLFIDDVQQGGTFGMFATGTNATGFGFYSNGTATSGEVVYFDDVNFYDPTAGGGSSGFALVDTSETMKPKTGQIDTLHAKTTPADTSRILQVQTTAVTKPAASDSLTQSVMAVMAYPNPATDVTTVKVRNTVKGSVVIELTSLYGQKLRSYSYQSNGGDFNANIPLQSLPSRTVYVITVKNNGKTVQTKLLK